jgi:nucleoid DNA-binding protein
MKLKFIRNWNNVYLRGFSFIVKTRAEKLEEIFQKYNNKIPAHNIPAFKPAKVLKEVKINNETK